MAENLIQPKEEPLYGQGQELAEAEAAIPLPEAEAAPVPPSQEQSPPAPPSTPQSTAPFAPRNLMQLVPPDLLYRGATTGTEGRPKLPAQVNYDAGLLWKVLADDPRASALTRFIAAKLLGEG